MSRIATGFPSLDALLGGGWPTGTLTELLVSGPGSGELGLLCPALARLNAAAASPGAAAGWVMLIAPPWIPYAPGLSWQGLALDRVLTVRVRQPPEALWVMDETLRSGACAGVIAWAGTTKHVLLQRLHLLAVRQQAWAVLIRAAQFRRQRSPARLRLEILAPSPVAPAPAERQPAVLQPAVLQVEIFKNGWRGTGVATVERRF
ncbi:MAG: hypothetical protein ABIX37_03070 [Gammaproteobacteria bacterium]